MHRWGKHTSGLSLDPLRSSNRSFRRSSPQRRMLSRSWSRSRLSRQSESSRDWSDPYLPQRSVRLILPRREIASPSVSFQLVYPSIASLYFWWGCDWRCEQNYRTLILSLMCKQPTNKQVRSQKTTLTHFCLISRRRETIPTFYRLPYLRIARARPANKNTAFLTCISIVSFCHKAGIISPNQMQQRDKGAPNMESGFFFAAAIT